MGNCCPGSGGHVRLTDDALRRHNAYDSISRHERYGVHGPPIVQSPPPSPPPPAAGLAQIFWDIENCPIPKTVHPAIVVSKLRELRTSRGYNPARIVAAVGREKLALHTREALATSGVDLLDSFSSKPSASDFVLLEEIQNWTFFNPPGSAGIILITSDRDYGRRLSFLRQVGYDVLLIHGAAISETLKSIAPHRLLWHEVCGVGKQDIIPAILESAQPSLAPNPSTFSVPNRPPTVPHKEHGAELGVGTGQRTFPVPEQENSAISLPPPPIPSPRSAITPTPGAIAPPPTPITSPPTSRASTPEASHDVGRRPPIETLQRDQSPTLASREVTEVDNVSEIVANTDSHFIMIANLERPKRSLDFWSAYGVLHWLNSACFHLAPGQSIPSHTFRCLISLAKRGLICASTPLASNPAAKATYLFLTPAGVSLFKRLKLINFKTRKNGPLKTFRHAVYFWMEWALVSSDAKTCRSSVLGGMLKPILAAGVVKSADGAPYTSVVAYIQDAASQGVFTITPFGETGDTMIVLQTGFSAVWSDIKGLCTKSTISDTLGLESSTLGLRASGRIVAATSDETLRFMPLLVVQSSQSNLMGSLDLYHVSRMLGYSNRHTYVRDASDAALITPQGHGHWELSKKGQDNMQAFKAAKENPGS